MTLCETFKQRASSTWNLISKGRKIKYQFLEETLTEINLFELKQKYPYDVITKTFTKPEEGNIGADWEWWLTGRSKLWLGFRVQAKVINVESNEYKHLHYSKKNDYGGKDYQCDRLINSALNHGLDNKPKPLIPLYCLYSNWSGEKIPFAWPYKTWKRNVRSYGCAIVSAFTVKYLRFKKESKDIKSLLPYMRPWQILVCGGDYSKGDLPQRALSFWKDDVKVSDDQMLGQLRSGLREDIIGGQSNIMGLYNTIELMETPPGYVQRMLEGLPVQAPDELVNRITIIREPA